MANTSGVSSFTPAPKNLPPLERNNNDIFANYPNHSKCSLTENHLEFDDPIISPPPGFLDKRPMYADVIVRNPASPQNFHVQSYREARILERMEFEMLEFYEELRKSRGFRGIPYSEILLNGFYAAKIHCKDGKWLRCRVERLYGEEQIWVHLIDHGNFEMISGGDIYLLRKPYRKLPFQAYNAHIYFSPKEKYVWDTETCIKFREEVDGRAFCALVIDEVTDSTTKTTSVSLILVDTSDPVQDKYVHHKLQSIYKKSNHKNPPTRS